MCGRTHTFLVSTFINIYENDIRNPLPQIRIKFEHEKSFLNIWKLFSRATDGVRTRDPDLGKVVLYQLSHCRIFNLSCFCVPLGTIYTILHSSKIVNNF